MYRNGDLGELGKHGSVHEYLLHLHQNGRQPIAMFWWGQQRVVSICSPELFKDTIKLTNRPSEQLDSVHVSTKYAPYVLQLQCVYVFISVCIGDQRVPGSMPTCC